MICRLCGQNKILIKAHAIPEAFFRLLRNEVRIPKLMTNTRGVFPQKSPIGVYDKGILCQDCEDKFDSWDNYAINLLINQIDKFELLHNGSELIAHCYPGYDYAKLKLFFISVLWRAAVSTHDFYSSVDLGSYEEKAKAHILTGDPGNEYDFSVLLALFTDTRDEKKLSSLILDPHKEIRSGVNVYKFYFGGIIAYIKTDKRVFPSPLSELVLNSNNALYLICREFEASEESNVMVSVIKNAHS